MFSRASSSRAQQELAKTAGRNHQAICDTEASYSLQRYFIAGLTAAAMK
jgi:hypothetical protein